MFDITKITNRQQPGKAEVIAEPGCPKSGELHGRDVRQANSHAYCGEPVKIKPVGSLEVLRPIVFRIEKHPEFLNFGRKTKAPLISALV